MDTLLQFDYGLFRFIHEGLSSSFLDAILIPVRHKLFWIPLYLFILSFVFQNFRNKKWIVFGFFALTIFLSDTISSKWIKKTVKRERPCQVEDLNVVSKVPCGFGFSFTSSHATNHFAIGVFLFLLLQGIWWRPFFLGWATVIALAQVYVGVHFPSDVICGAIIGAIIGFSSYSFYKFVSSKLISKNIFNKI